jgi:hypothetical protein
MPCASGVHWVLGHFPSVVKFVWLLLIKCLRKSSVKCDSHTVLTFSLISFATSTPGMRHDTQYWENKISCCLNAMCYWSPLGFRTLSKCCQVCLTLTYKMLEDIKCKMWRTIYTCSNMHCSCIHTPITWRGLSLGFVADYIRTYEQFGTREFVSMYKHSWT